ncbi:hypothetical protein JJB07_11320 [Tumebacillus sp. ITR2]|uniref:Uncharacterized protein n=1 Tax=Tumebacillus amylolyticus TaxID=2801339 RepID=A0ABS1JAH6_9BACL|nr:hypothetical protein [Tumebacillus amylolyticus]MBL0387240.1 hypothetical protein [Tumebacillus amylolyticus]
MDEKNLPNWLLMAIVVGLGELSYYLWKHYGMLWTTKSSMAVTGVAAAGFLVIYFSRLVKSKNSKK